MKCIQCGQVSNDVLAHKCEKPCETHGAINCSVCNDFFKSKAEKFKLHEKEDLVNHPKHYTSHPSGVECADIADHYGFNLGNVIKYIWRNTEKFSCPIQDLEKAEWYLKREIQKRKKK